MIRLRHTDEWVGLLVIVAVVIFFGSVLEAGVLRDWFRPTGRLRIVLPQTGVGGLAVGADVQVLGIHAGTVRRIVLSPNEQMYAEADIDQQTEPFIRRDSQAVIRRQFGLAGAAYVDISRGTGTPMDWKFAVIDATTERAPSDTISTMIDQVQERVRPVLEDAKQAMDSIVAITGRLENGQGTLGRLATDDTLARRAEQTIATAQQQIANLGEMIAKLDDVAKQADALAQTAASRQQGMPELLRHVDAILANLQSATHDITRASPRLPEIARSMASGTADLPALLTQTQLTAEQLERLLVQLQGVWLLGGGGHRQSEPNRLPVTQIQP